MHCCSIRGRSSEYMYWISFLFPCSKHITKYDEHWKEKHKNKLWNNSFTLLRAFLYWIEAVENYRGHSQHKLAVHLDLKAKYAFRQLIVVIVKMVKELKDNYSQITTNVSDSNWVGVMSRKERGLTVCTETWTALSHRSWISSWALNKSNYFYPIS